MLCSMLVDDVITAVDIEGLAGDQARRIMRQKRGGGTGIVDARLRLCSVRSPQRWNT